MPTPVDTCLFCGEKPKRCFELARVRGWRYVRCENCGLVFLDPQPTSAELEHFYNHSYCYDVKRYRDSIRHQGILLDSLEESCGGPGYLLEIGCSYGYFLKAAQKRGWAVQGIELSEAAADHARKNLGLAVDAGRVLDFQKKNHHSFDAIAAWHVLEHDPAPRAFVDAAYDLLRDGGILALRVPNLDSTVAKLSGACWQWLSAPEHVCMYTQESLSQLLAKSNFEVLNWGTARGNARNTWFEILRARTKSAAARWAKSHRDQSDHFRFDPPPVYQDRLWYRAAESTITACTAPVDWALSSWMQRNGLEAELVVFARKPFSSVETESHHFVHVREAAANGNRSHP